MTNITQTNVQEVTVEMLCFWNKFSSRSDFILLNIKLPQHTFQYLLLSAEFQCGMQ